MLDFNSERIMAKNIYHSNERNESKDLNDNEQENEEEIQANLLYVWGFAKYGQLGYENMNYVLNPRIMYFSQNINSDQFADIIDIEPVCGESHTALLIKDSKGIYLYMCGKNVFGQIGIVGNSYIYGPVLIENISEKQKIKKVVLGGEHSIVISKKNEVFSTGLNLFGQLGIGDFENRNIFEILM